MQLVRGAYNFSRAIRGTVATIGNFDGVHRGHQAVIRQVQRKAKELGVKTTVILFEPQPVEYFRKDEPPLRIFPLRDKLRCLANMGIDQVVCLNFDKDFASQKPEEFVQKNLVDGLDVKHVVIGDDFRYGYKRQGDFESLKASGEQHGFTVEDSDSVIEFNRRISSTWIRELLQAYDIEMAGYLMGRPYQLSGKVAHGAKLGRTLGFPTLNLVLPPLNFPLKGVFAVLIHGLDEEVKCGVANLGYKPSVSRGETFNLEVHVLDFEQQVYGKRIIVEMKRYIRGEQKFESLLALQKAIAADIRTARNYFETLE